MPNIRIVLLLLLCTLTMPSGAQEIKPTKLDVLLEMERRGILPESEKPLLAEARRRGLVPNKEPSTGHDPAKEQERLMLFHDCHPIWVGVYGGRSEDAKKIGLRNKDMEELVENRLRVARLYVKDLNGHFDVYGGYPATLDVFVSVLGAAFRINLEYTKNVRDEFGASGLATTWNGGTFGTHGKDSDYIMSVLSRQMDKFLVEYLRVNEAACEAK